MSAATGNEICRELFSSSLENNTSYFYDYSCSQCIPVQSCTCIHMIHVYFDQVNSVFLMNRSIFRRSQRIRLRKNFGIILPTEKRGVIENFRKFPISSRQLSMVSRCINANYDDATSLKNPIIVMLC